MGRDAFAGENTYYIKFWKNMKKLQAQPVYRQNKLTNLFEFYGDDGMKKKAFLIIFSLALVCLIGFLLLASPWILLGIGLWLSPAPPKPEITYGEFDFQFVYEIDGNVKTIEDTIICEFDGFNIDEGRGKTRRWKESFENEQNNELYAWRVEQIDNPDYNEYKGGRKPDYNQIVLENIDHYKVLLSVADAEYFLGEPENKRTSPIEPSIQVYDKETCYYIESKEFLKEHDFNVISWKCDEPIENTFK